MSQDVLLTPREVREQLFPYALELEKRSVEAAAAAHFGSEGSPFESFDRAFEHWRRKEARRPQA